MSLFSRIVNPSDFLFRSVHLKAYTVLLGLEECFREVLYFETLRIVQVYSGFHTFDIVEDYIHMDVVQDEGRNIVEFEVVLRDGKVEQQKAA